MRQSRRSSSFRPARYAVPHSLSFSSSGPWLLLLYRHQNHLQRIRCVVISGVRHAIRDHTDRTSQDYVAGESGAAAARWRDPQPHGLRLISCLRKSHDELIGTSHLDGARRDARRTRFVLAVDNAAEPLIAVCNAGSFLVADIDDQRAHLGAWRIAIESYRFISPARHGRAPAQHHRRAQRGHHPNTHFKSPAPGSTGRCRAA